MPSSAATPDKVDDFALMRAITDDDSAAFKNLYERHSPIVHALCLRMLKDRGEAEQLLTDVFFEIWNTRDRYDETRANPLTYLLRITRSRAIDKLRRKNAFGPGKGISLDTASGIDVPTLDTPSLAAESSEKRSLIAKALQNLDRDQRAAIECAYYDGLSHSQIAERLNKPLGTIKSSLRLGLIRLRELLSQFNNTTTEQP